MANAGFEPVTFRLIETNYATFAIKDIKFFIKKLNFHDIIRMIILGGKKKT